MTASDNLKVGVAYPHDQVVASAQMSWVVPQVAVVVKVVTRLPDGMIAAAP
jgi:hypothetical protein